MVTQQEIDAGRSPKGGWTRDQLAQWGVPWPPPRGWRKALIAAKGESVDLSPRMQIERSCRRGKLHQRMLQGRCVSYVPPLRNGYYVYLLLDQAGNVAYAGSTNNVYRRLGQHIDEGVKQFESIMVIECADRPHAEALERDLIRKYKPDFNKILYR